MVLKESEKSKGVARRSRSNEKLKEEMHGKPAQLR